MPILEKFCNAFKKAIIEYEAEMGGKIPVKRQATVDKLRTLLDDYQRDECTRILLLKKDEALPAADRLDKFTVYLVQDNERIIAHWYAHGGAETFVITDKEKCDQIKKAEFQNNQIEKSNALLVFNNVIKLCEYTPRKLDSLVVREKMMTNFQKIPVPLAFIGIFKSRLGIKLQGVLDNPNFSEKRLSIEERREIIDRQEMNNAQIKLLTNQVGALGENLKKEQAKDNVQTVNALLLALDREKTNTTFLTQANMELQLSVDTLFAKCTTLETTNEELIQEKAKLQTDYVDLKAKYEALLQEKASKSSHDEPKSQTKSGFFG